MAMKKKPMGKDVSPKPPKPKTKEKETITNAQNRNKSVVALKNLREDAYFVSKKNDRSGYDKFNYGRRDPVTKKLIMDIGRTTQRGLDQAKRAKEAKVTKAQSDRMTAQAKATPKKK